MPGIFILSDFDLSISIKLIITKVIF
jgi:hypothetical protein